MDDLSSHVEGDEVDDGPRSYSLDYVLLDRSASDDPVWVLCRFTAVRAADLDSIGLEWATQELMKVLNPRPVPGGGFTYRLGDGEE